MKITEDTMQFLRNAFDHKLLSEDVDSWDVEQSTEAWIALDYLNHEIDARRKALRVRLMGKAEKFGRQTDKGGQMINIGGALVVRERRVSPSPDAKLIQKVLDDQELDYREVFSKKTEQVIDPSKIQHLVEIGRLDRAQVDQCRKVTWALKVRTPPHVFAQLDGEFGKPDGMLEVAELRPKRSKAVGKRK